MAEANGFDSVWMPEHLVFPAEMPAKYLYTPDGYPPMRSDTPSFDPWVVLGGVATRTSTLRLGHGFIAGQDPAPRGAGRHHLYGRAERGRLAGTKDDFLDWIKRFADEVMTKL
jgi:hypothetical protein